MAGRRLDGGALRIRRATRHDLPGLRRLLAVDAADRSERFERRLVRHLAGEVAVVEDEDGAPVGALSVVVFRSFSAGHWRAQLDGLWVSPGGESHVDRILDAALEWAARRHCHALFAIGPLGPYVTAALERRGATREAAWRLGVTPVPAPVAGRGRRRRA
jgi:GNAT superfamily N-acetyltransferase